MRRIFACEAALFWEADVSSMGCSTPLVGGQVVKHVLRKFAAAVAGKTNDPHSLGVFLLRDRYCMFGFFLKRLRAS